MQLKNIIPKYVISEEFVRCFVEKSLRVNCSIETAAPLTQTSTLTRCTTTPWRPSWIWCTKNISILWILSGKNTSKYIMESLEKWQKWKIWKRSQDWWNFQAGKWSWKGVFWPQESSNMVQECDARGHWHQPYLPILTSQVNLDSSKIVAYREANTNGNLATESMNLQKKIPTQNYGKN